MNNLGHFVASPDVHNVLALLLRLTLAAFLGAVVGVERSFHRKPAGLRTIMFISFGSCLFTIVSEIFPLMHGSSDVTHIAAQVVSGIGFLGAGSILHARGSVVGLTTAATIFVMASIGMACGAGLYLIALFSTLLLLAGLLVLGKVEHKFRWHPRTVTYTLTASDLVVAMDGINRVLDESSVSMQHIRCTRTLDPAGSVIEITSNIPEDAEAKLVKQLMAVPTVSKVEFAESEME